MSAGIDSVAALEAHIGKKPAAVDMKVIDHIDAEATRWLAASPLFFAAFGAGNDIGITLGGGEPGCVAAVDPKHLRLPRALLDDPQLGAVGHGFGALFLLPGIGEMLRVNGRVAAVYDEAIEIAVEECYAHCAKALIRSALWSAQPTLDVPDTAGDFLAACRFMALATIDAQGCADVSPKGDPAGALLRLHGECVWYADRPGNRRVDSFRNILTQPRIAAVALIPGSTRIAVLRGRAQISADPAVRAPFAVDGKIPLLATCVDSLQLNVHDSAALARAALWPALAPADIDPAALFAAHVKLNRARGVHASLTRAMVSIPGLMAKGLAHDYKKNLY